MTNSNSDALANIPSASHPRTNDKAFELISTYISDNVRILDLGAGRGHLARRIGTKLTQLGLDPKKHLIATDLFEEIFQATEIPFKKANFNEQLVFPPSSFDVIYSIEVVEHLRNPYEFINECFRLLRPGGKLIVSTPNTLNIKSRIDYLLTGYHELYMAPSTLPINAGAICGHIMPLHVGYYDYAVRLAGFDDLKVFCDKEKSLARYIYFLFYPLIRAMFYLYRRRVKRYSMDVYAENERALSLMQSRTILTSRSLMFVAHKPGQ